jgi:hypothetical protein
LQVRVVSQALRQQLRCASRAAAKLAGSYHDTQGNGHDMNNGDVQVTVTEVRKSGRTNPAIQAELRIVVQTGGHNFSFDDCKVLKSKAGQLWFALPTFPQTIGREYVYRPAVVLDSDLFKTVADAALESYSAWLKQQAVSVG